MPEALRFLGLNSIQEPPISEAEVFARPRQAQPAQSAGSDASSFPWPPPLLRGTGKGLEFRV